MPMFMVDVAEKTGATVYSVLCQVGTGVSFRSFFLVKLGVSGSCRHGKNWCWKSSDRIPAVIVVSSHPVNRVTFRNRGRELRRSDVKNSWSNMLHTIQLRMYRHRPKKTVLPIVQVFGLTPPAFPTPIHLLGGSIFR